MRIRRQGGATIAWFSVTVLGVKTYLPFFLGGAVLSEKCVPELLAPIGARQKTSVVGWSRTPSIPVVLSRVRTHCLFLSMRLARLGGLDRC